MESPGFEHGASPRHRVEEALSLVQPSLQRNAVLTNRVAG
jgi:hypothetical protein